MAVVPNTLKGFGITLKQVFKKPITQQYPEYKRPIYPRFRGRHRLHVHENGLDQRAYLIRLEQLVQLVLRQVRLSPFGPASSTSANGLLTVGGKSSRCQGEPPRRASLR